MPGAVEERTARGVSALQFVACHASAKVVPTHLLADLAHDSRQTVAALLTALLSARDAGTCLDEGTCDRHAILRRRLCRRHNERRDASARREERRRDPHRRPHESLDAETGRDAIRCREIDAIVLCLPEDPFPIA